MLAVKAMRLASYGNKWQSPKPGIGFISNSYVNAFSFTRMNIRRRKEQ